MKSNMSQIGFLNSYKDFFIKTDGKIAGLKMTGEKIIVNSRDIRIVINDSEVNPYQDNVYFTSSKKLNFINTFKDAHLLELIGNKLGLKKHTDEKGISYKVNGEIGLAKIIFVKTSKKDEQFLFCIYGGGIMAGMKNG